MTMNLDASKGGAVDAAAASSTAVRRGGMELDEAIKILNIGKDAQFQEVLKVPLSFFTLPSLSTSCSQEA